LKRRRSEKIGHEWKNNVRRLDFLFLFYQKKRKPPAGKEFPKSLIYNFKRPIPFKSFF
jgi:hypothetical protein